VTWEAGVLDREVGFETGLNEAEFEKEADERLEAEAEFRWKLKADWGREGFEAAETEPV
jgi:hypothetical protein